MRKTKNTLKKFQGVFCFICLYICLLALPEILKYNFACRRVKIQTACKSLMEGDLFMLFQTLKSIGELYKEPWTWFKGGSTAFRSRWGAWEGWKISLKSLQV